MKTPSFDEVPHLLQQSLEAQESLKKQLQDFTKTISDLQRPGKEILSIEDTCELLGISRITLWRWEKKGVVKSYGLDSGKYFKRSEIIASLVPLNH